MSYTPFPCYSIYHHSISFRKKKGVKRFLSPLPCSLSPVPLKHTQEWPGHLSSRRKPCTPIPWEEKAQSCIERPENTRVPLESAKAEVQKPFPQEEDLAAETARLNELNALSNPDKKEK